LSSKCRRFKSLSCARVLGIFPLNLLPCKSKFILKQEDKVVKTCQALCSKVLHGG
jgi:hypothetical protein